MTHFYRFLAEDDYSTYSVQQPNTATDVPEDAADTHKVLGTDEHHTMQIRNKRLHCKKKQKQTQKLVNLN